MDKVFLDANILFSAAYKLTKLRQLWTLNNVSLISSTYCVIEAERNLVRLKTENLEVFEQLLTKVTMIQVPFLIDSFPLKVNLVDKDRPVLQGAIFTNSDYLLTGDFKHFGHLFNQSIEGVTILSPAQYFQLKNI